MSARIYLIWAALIVQALTIAALGFVINEQQTAIEALIISQDIETDRASRASQDLEILTRAFVEHMEEHQKMRQQMDLLVAAARSGWGDAYRLLRAGVLERE